jgi:hypothetical protein
MKPQKNNHEDGAFAIGDRRTPVLKFQDSGEGLPWPRRSSIRIASVFALSCVSCVIADVPPPELLSIEPADCVAGQETAVTVRGRGFHPIIHSNLQHPERNEIILDFDLHLSTPELVVPLADVAFVSTGELQATVPSGLAPGSYALVLTDPRGRTATLLGAFEARPGGQQVGPPCNNDTDCAYDACAQSSQCALGFCVYDKDSDGDGHIDAACGGDDCDDTCAQCWSERPDTCDGLDNDCEASTPDGSGDPSFGEACDGPDEDLCLEGLMVCDGIALHCDDATDTIEEVPGDELDQDCDGREICFADADGDGFRSSDTLSSEDDDCRDNGEATAAQPLDCDDDPLACGSACYPDRPGADDCDGADNDCDGSVDEDPELVWYHDTDLDGFTNNSDTQNACSDPDGGATAWVASPTANDCADTSGDDPLCNGYHGVSCNPGLTGADGCDGADNDCDGTTDEDCAFSHKKSVTVDATGIGSSCTTSLSDFPVVVTLTGSEFQEVEDDVDADGYDIIFQAEDTTICGGAPPCQLDHEIETYDEGNDLMIAWVRMPSLSDTTDTTIHMYYGNSAITSPTENPQGVWDGEYKGVWHLNEDVTDEGSADAVHMDSTANNNDGNQRGNAATTGKIGIGQYFDGVNDYVDMGDPANGSLDFGTGSFTFSIWFQSSDTNAILLGKRADSGTPGYDMIVGEAATVGRVRGRLSDNGEDRFSPSWEGTDDGQWHHVAVVVDRPRDLIFTYGDGGRIGVDHFISGLGSVSNSVNFYLGSRAAGTSAPANAQADEVRLSSGARSACWIETGYNNQNDPTTFLNIGSEQPTSQ